MPSFIGDIVGGVADAVGSVVGAVGDVVGSVTDFLGPVGTLAAAYFGMPYLGSALGAAEGGFSAFGAPGILGGTAEGMMTADMIGGSLVNSSIMPSLFSTAASLGGSLGSSSLFDSLASFGSNLSNSFMPGEVGGMPTGTGSFGNWTNLLKSGMNIYNALNYGTGQSPTAAQQNADPYAPYRQDAARQLNQLMQNPSLVYGMPGYNFAQEQSAKAIQRQAAATGGSISGGTLASLQQNAAGTAQNWFNNYVNQLTTQSGANQSPYVGQAAYSTAQDFQAKAEKARQTALLQGIVGAGSAVAGFFG